MAHQLAMNTGLLLDRRDQPQVDILHCQAVQRAVEQHVQLQQRLRIKRLIHLDHRVPDQIALNDNHRQNVIPVHLRQLDELDLVARDRRHRYERCVVRIVRQQLCRLLQQILEMILMLQQQRLHFLHFLVFFLQKLVHIHAVAPVGRNASRRGVRLNNQSHLLQI